MPRGARESLAPFCHHRSCWLSSLSWFIEVVIIGGDSEGREGRGGALLCCYGSSGCKDGGGGRTLSLRKYLLVLQ